jgi:hypothetical protein
MLRYLYAITIATVATVLFVAVDTYWQSKNARTPSIRLNRALSPNRLQCFSASSWPSASFWAFETSTELPSPITVGLTGLR